MRARRRHAVRRGRQDLDRVGAPVPVVRGVGQAGPDPFTRQCMPDEDDPALVTSHTRPTVRHRPDVQLDNRRGRVNGRAAGLLGAAGPVPVAAHRRVAPVVPASVPAAAVPAVSRPAASRPAVA